MKIEKVPEYELSSDTKAKLQQLLAACFPEYLSDRIYYKQYPHFRYLGWNHDNLVAQMGVEHRVISLGKDPVRVFGIVDLCVNPDYRNKGFARELTLPVKNC